ncbi:MAG: circadian clock protein KaiA [Leptolyngbyaceae cyanobacterium HOT.MB2.61]|jgi:circadian clock protein KaiA|nr:circadian clock protein KaiA [Leptolyngbyaceae cyanobacterium HOT.MB2.61]
MSLTLRRLSDHLSICVLLKEEPLVQAVLKYLSGKRYTVALLRSVDEFFVFIEQEKQQLDCLVLQADSELPSLTKWLHGQAVLLPAVIIQSESDQAQPPEVPLLGHEGEGFTYHTAEVCLNRRQIEQLPEHIDRAIAQFIHLSPSYRLNRSPANTDQTTDLNAQNFLKLQQQRLTEKLKERLGYLGVYYKRNPKNFLRNLPAEQKRELLEQLRHEYRDIVLSYFSNDSALNQRIDDFVNTVFFTDIPVAQVVEIHMDLMDEFAKQLKLEGRSEEILLDYRLTLIDTIAHLCEMYRRSIPGGS